MIYMFAYVGFVGFISFEGFFFLSDPFVSIPSCRENYTVNWVFFFLKFVFLFPSDLDWF